MCIRYIWYSSSLKKEKKKWKGKLARFVSLQQKMIFASMSLKYTRTIIKRPHYFFPALLLLLYICFISPAKTIEGRTKDLKQKKKKHKIKLFTKEQSQKTTQILERERERSWMRRKQELRWILWCLRSILEFLSFKISSSLETVSQFDFFFHDFLSYFALILPYFCNWSKSEEQRWRSEFLFDLQCTLRAASRICRPSTSNWRRWSFRCRESRTACAKKP